MVSLFVNPGIYFEIYLAWEIKRIRKRKEKQTNKLQKNLDHSKLASGPPLEGMPDVNFGRDETLSIVCHVGLSCRLFIHEVFFGPLGVHLRVLSELGRSPPFQPMRALRLQWSWAFSLVCEVALKFGNLGDLEVNGLTSIPHHVVNNSCLHVISVNRSYI